MVLGFIPAHWKAMPRVSVSWNQWAVAHGGLPVSGRDLLKKLNIDPVFNCKDIWTQDGRFCQVLVLVHSQVLARLSSYQTKIRRAFVNPQTVDLKRFCFQTPLASSLKGQTLPSSVSAPCPMASTPGPTSSSNKISGEFSMVEIELRPECLLPPVRVYSPEDEYRKKGLPPLRGCHANIEEENLKKTKYRTVAKRCCVQPCVLSECLHLEFSDPRIQIPLSEWSQNL